MSDGADEPVACVPTKAVRLATGGGSVNRIGKALTAAGASFLRAVPYLHPLGRRIG